jgi:AraC family transcriptional regulator
MAPHSHDEPCLGVVLGGDFRERIFTSERTYRRGCMAFCPPGVLHSQEFGVSGARQIVFTPDRIWLDYLADCKLQLDDAPNTTSMFLARLGDRLGVEMRNDDPYSAFARDGILLELIAEFGRRSGEARSTRQPPPWLRTAREFLRANATGRVSVAQVAAAAGRHEIHLAREFRRFYGTSIGTYLRNLKTERAAQLLRDSSLTICDIALDCGFANQSHLTREFKARYGVTPSRYRARR